MIFVNSTTAWAISVVMKLGIADQPKDGSRSSDELAAVTSTHEPALYRLTRFLSAVGLFQETAPRQFVLTPLGTGLRVDVPGSLRSNALMQLDELRWPAWGQLLHSVQTGQTSFGHVHGAELFAYLGTNSEPTSAFQRAMTSNIARSGPAITRVYDFSGIRRIVDVVVGHGLFLATILGACPDMRGVLFDRPEIVPGAASVLEARGVADRCDIVGGDFFSAVPPDGDAYLLRQIIHDWDDARSAIILEKCRRTMRKSRKVLLVERALAPDHHLSLGALHLDREMLVNLGGMQRTDIEHGALFEAAGIGMSTAIPLGDTAQFSVFEGQPIAA
jgi:O-methyltransferase domain